MTYLKKLEIQHHTVHWSASLNNLPLGTQLFLQPVAEGLSPRIVTLDRPYARQDYEDCCVDEKGNRFILKTSEYEIWVIAKIKDSNSEEIS